MNTEKQRMPLGVIILRGMEHVSKAARTGQNSADGQDTHGKSHTPSLIQTILSVLEFHQISACALADFTADRELHPALKTFSAIQLSL